MRAALEVVVTRRVKAFPLTLTGVCNWCFQLREDGFLRVRRRAWMWFRMQQYSRQPVCLVPESHFPSKSTISIHTPVSPPPADRGRYFRAILMTLISDGARPMIFEPENSALARSQGPEEPVLDSCKFQGFVAKFSRYLPLSAPPPPTFAPLDPLGSPLRSLPPAALTAAPVKVTPVLPSSGDDAAWARPAGDVTAVPANPTGIRPDGALPLGTAVTPSPQVPRAIHEVIHVQP